jgi:hypothetical protein
LLARKVYLVKDDGLKGADGGIRHSLFTDVRKGSCCTRMVHWR